MSKLKSALVAVALTASVVTSTGVAAEAAPVVTIKKIANKTIEEGAKATIRPRVSHASRVTITSKTLTVKKDGETVVDRKTSAKLKAGTYRVTTKVAFKTWASTSDGSRKFSSLRHKSKSQNLEITTKKVAEESDDQPDAKHECTTTSSGTCIAGGQFCPQAKYGQNGWDAEGRMYICTGDRDHPHWMTP